jgi:hypothetical protein
VANELNISLETGLTLTAKVYSFAGVQQGVDTSLTETATGVYSASFNVSGLADGAYMVLIYNGTEQRGFGGLYVRAGTEVTQEEFATIFDVIVGANA